MVINYIFIKTGIYVNNSVTHDIETEMSTLIPKLNNRNIEEAMCYVARISKREIESGFEFIAFNNRCAKCNYNAIYGIYTRYYYYK